MFEHPDHMQPNWMVMIFRGQVGESNSVVTVLLPLALREYWRKHKWSAPELRRHQVLRLRIGDSPVSRGCYQATSLIEGLCDQLFVFLAPAPITGRNSAPNADTYRHRMSGIDGECPVGRHCSLRETLFGGQRRRIARPGVGISSIEHRLLGARSDRCRALLQ